MNSFEEFKTSRRNILITGGAGFIGGAVIRRLLKNTNFKIFNLDKIGYASDLTSIEKTLLELDTKNEDRYKLLNVDLSNFSDTSNALNFSNPDLIMHLAAESHVDRSIQGPLTFIQSNILGTFNLLEATRNYYEKLNGSKKESFKFHHISTDEVFGSLGINGKFSESSQYDPRSPYSASKASSDHLVSSWFHTYGLPAVITNCSNNYGPWQFPEKFIPVIIMNALADEEIPIYGDGLNIRDWLFVEDHVTGLLKVLHDGRIGQKYCIGGNSEKTNNEVANIICEILDNLIPRKKSYKTLIIEVNDRKGHDRRYAINAKKIKKELGWEPSIDFKDGINKTIKWYIKNYDWAYKLIPKKNQIS